MDKNIYIVYHLGARDNYLLTEILTSKKKNVFLVTDFWFRQNLIINYLFPKSKRRFSNKISSKKIISFNIWQSIKYIIKSKYSKNKFALWNFTADFFQVFFLRKVKIISNERYVFFGYTGGNFKVLEALKKNNNILFVHVQFDPGLIYYDLENLPDHNDKKIFLSNLKKEWELSDVIIVNSDYSYKCLVEVGVNENKIKIVPLAYNKQVFDFKKNNNQKLKIAFVGNINKIKGFEIFLEVAKNTHHDFDFIAIGNTFFEDDFLNEAKKYISFLGFLNKDEMEEIYKKIDILVFPTLCDGFGMVQLEAMANGIPVIASNFCAKIVIEEVNGYITNEVNEIISKLKILNKDRSKLSEMSKNAFQRAKEFDEKQYLDGLNAALKEFDLKL